MRQITAQTGSTPALRSFSVQLIPASLRRPRLDFITHGSVLGAPASSWEQEAVHCVTHVVKTPASRIHASQALRGFISLQWAQRKALNLQV